MWALSSRHESANDRTHVKLNPLKLNRIVEDIVGNEALKTFVAKRVFDVD